MYKIFDFVFYSCLAVILAGLIAYGHSQGAWDQLIYGVKSVIQLY